LEEDLLLFWTLAERVKIPMWVSQIKNHEELITRIWRLRFSIK
jgi:hypothetical protein